MNESAWKPTPLLLFTDHYTLIFWMITKKQLVWCVKAQHYYKLIKLIIVDFFTISLCFILCNNNIISLCVCVTVCIEKAFYWLYLLHVLNFHKNPVLCECVYERGGERIKYMHSFTWLCALWAFIFITGLLCSNIYTVCSTISIRLPLSQCWFYHHTVVSSRWSQWECLVFICLFCLI